MELDQWLPARRYTYGYDNHNNLLSELDEVFSDSAWTVSGRTTYIYDPSGNVTLETIENVKNSVLTP